MGDSMMSHKEDADADLLGAATEEQPKTESVEHPKKEDEGKNEQADFDDFGDFKSDKMGDSMMSHKEDADLLGAAV